MKLITFDIDNYSDNTAVYPQFCNGLIFRNMGDVDATINGIPLPAGSVNDDFNNNFPGDVMKNEFRLVFEPTSIGTNPFVSVIRKFEDTIAKELECNYKRNKRK